MLSIRRERQVKLFIILASVFLVLFIATMIIGFFPYGLHKKSMKNVAIPKDALLYMSVENSSESIGKIIESIYAYRISHDQSMFEFSLILKNIDSFVNKMQNDKSFYTRTFSKYVYSRNASILFWSLAENNINDSEIYFIFDIGRLPSLMFNIFMNVDNFNIESDNYKIKRVKYNNIVINSVTKNNNNNVIFFTTFDGLLIFAKEYNHVVKLIEFLKSKASNLNEVEILKKAEEDYKPDMSLYINKKRYDILKGKDNILFTPLKYIGEEASSLYLYTKLHDDRGFVDIYVDYEYGGSDRAILYSLGGITNTPSLLSKEDTVFFLSLKAQLPSLYPLLFNDMKKLSNTNVLALNAYESLQRINNEYILSDMIRELKGEASAILLNDKSLNVNYPIISFEVKNESYLIPFFEESLIKKYGKIDKFERNYKNNFIYLYNIPNSKSLYYTSKNNVLFMSENEKALEILISGFNKKNNISNYIKKNANTIVNSDYLLTFDFANAQNLIKTLDLPFKTWTYPTSVIAGSTVGSNYTHVKILFFANLESKNN